MVQTRRGSQTAGPSLEEEQCGKNENQNQHPCPPIQMTSHMQQDLRDYIEHGNTVMARPVGCERQVKLTDFVGTKFHQIFTERGWLNVCKVDIPASTKLVQEFYGNIEEIEDEGEGLITSAVNDCCVNISPDIIAETYQIKRIKNATVARKEPFTMPSLDEVAQELCNDPNRQWDVTSNTLDEALLTADYKLLSVVFSSNIHPQIHRKSLTVAKAMVMWGIFNDNLFDLPSYMYNVILSAYYSSSQSELLPLGSLITRIIMRSGVTVRRGPRMGIGRMLAPIDRSTIPGFESQSIPPMQGNHQTHCPVDGRTSGSENPNTSPSMSNPTPRGSLERILAEVRCMSDAITSLEQSVQSDLNALNKKVKSFEDYIFK